MSLSLLTNSALGTFRQCPKNYEWSYVHRLRPVKESDAIRFGSLFHECMNAWWVKDGTEATALEVVKKSLEAAQISCSTEEESKYEEYKAAHLRAVVRAYTTHYSHGEYRALEIEKEFKFTIDREGFEGIVFAGKIDKILENQDGRKLIGEHKTTTMEISDPTAPYWRRLTMDPQISTYWLGAGSLGYEVDSCLYDVTRRPKHSPLMATPPDKMKFKKDGTPYATCRAEDEKPEDYEARVHGEIMQEQGKYFSRQNIVRLPQEMEAHLEDLRKVIAALKHSREVGFHKNPLACFGRGTCPFLDACCGLEDPTISDRFRVAPVENEELAEEGE